MVNVLSIRQKEQWGGLLLEEEARFMLKRGDTVDALAGAEVLLHRARMPREEENPGQRAGYFGWASIAEVRPEGQSDWCVAKFDDYIAFETPIPPSDHAIGLDLAGAGHPRDPHEEQLSMRGIDEGRYWFVLSLGLGLAADGDPTDGLGEDVFLDTGRIARQFRQRRIEREPHFRRLIAGKWGRCAITGARHEYPRGATLCEAAYVWRGGRGPDSPRNGVLLAPHIHRYWEAGAIWLEDDHGIVLAPELDPDELGLAGNPARRLLLPQDRAFWPHPEFVRRHRAEALRKRLDLAQPAYAAQ